MKKAPARFSTLAFCLLLLGGGGVWAQNPLAGLEQAVKQKAAETAISTLLNNQLPLVLNAKSIYPTVSVLPGGPFQPTLLTLTTADVDKPLPPGDYQIPMWAFCSEYSVHRPGAGVAYVLGPMEGKAGPAIAALYWRGVVEKNVNPQLLLYVGWTIQSGITYAQMPKTYQAVIDEVIPDYKVQLSGDFFQSLENTYQSYAKPLNMPPLDQVLAKMGKPGELALSAERQRAGLLRQNTSDQIKEQTLFAGQESGVYTPVKLEDGPWTERIKGVAYMKLKIVGGNMVNNNVMQIRILPAGGNQARVEHGPRLARASYEVEQTEGTGAPQPTLSSLVQGVIGYSVGQGAQALAQIPALPAAPAVPAKTKAGTVNLAQGTVTVIRDGATIPLKNGDTIYENDTIVTGPNSGAQVSFADNTQLNMSANTKLLMDSFVYDGNTPARSSLVMQWLKGAFVFTSGLIGKNGGHEQIQAGFGCICIRGTEFVAKFISATSVEVDLISGSAAIGPNGTDVTPGIPAPAKILYNGSKVTRSPLTAAQYAAIKAQLMAKSPGS